MPLSKKGEKIKAAMQDEYGKDKGESVFDASKNAGTISGVESDERQLKEAFYRRFGRKGRKPRE